MEIKATATKLPESDRKVKGIASLSFGRDLRVRSMLSRRFLRVKSFQALYSYFQSEDRNMKKIRK
jgi:hypothetical protein